MASFCKGCGGRVEWHPRADGVQVSIDPDPHPQGNLAFNKARRLEAAPPGSRPRMYRYHLVACAKPVARRDNRVAACEHEECDRTDRHRHCFKCGDTDHFVAECPEVDS